MNIDLEFDAILKKYRLKKEEDIPYAVKLSQNHIINMWNKIPKDYNIALWCAGTHTKELFKLIENKNQIKCIIDNNTNIQDDLFEGIKIISKKEIKKYNIDLIVISTMSYNKEIKSEIKSLGYKYLDFYEDTCDEDINTDKIIKNVIWFSDLRKYGRTTYISICLLKQMYDKQEDYDIKEFWLKNIIKEYLNIRDFINSKKYIYIYIENNFKNTKKYKDFLEELDVFLGKIKSIIYRRKNIDFIFNVCDALKYDTVCEAKNEINNLTFFKQISNESIYYENAYSNSTYTRPSFKSMFEETLVIDDGIYKSHEYSIDLNKSTVLKYFLENEYTIINNSVMKIKSSNKNDNIINNVRSKIEQEACSLQLWRMICYFCLNKNNILVINHFMESHTQYLSGDNEKMMLTYKNGDEKIKKQYYMSVKYIDKQLLYYSEFFPKEAYNVFTSDHGHSDLENGSKFDIHHSKDCVIKTPLIINNRKLENKLIENLFDKRDIGKLLINLHRGKNIYSYGREYVEIQRDALYDIYKNEEFLKAGEKTKKRFAMAFKAVRTVNEKYILFENGLEELYINSNEEKNIINDRKYNRLVEKMRSYIRSDVF